MFMEMKKIFIMFFNIPSVCGVVIPYKTGSGLALGFNTLYFKASGKNACFPCIL